MKILLIGCALVVGVVSLSLASPLGQKVIHKSKSNQSSQSATRPAPQKPTEVRLNQEARDGNFAFVVASVDAAQRAVNVHLTVKNASNRPAVFWTDNQRLWVGGKWFVPDKAAAAKAGTASVKLDPGKFATVVLVFNVSSDDTVVDHIELHDAAVSAGITVVPRS